MKFSASIATLATIGLALGQGITDKISPKQAAPPGCQSSFSGLFQVTVVDVTTVTGKRDVAHLQVRAFFPN